MTSTRFVIEGFTWACYVSRMKPTGPIPPYFTAQNGELSIGGKTASALVAQAGDTPLFVYSTAALDARISELRAAMPRALSIHYAMKGNPFPPLLAHMALQVDGFDVASGGELKLALAAGVAPDKISFAGPGKRDRELEFAIANGATLNLESEGEATRALSIAAQLGVTPRLAVRINPTFDLKGSGMKMGGGAKPFGVDADRVPGGVKLKRNTCPHLLVNCEYVWRNRPLRQPCGLPPPRSWPVPGRIWGALCLTLPLTRTVWRP
jgi:diaminopimelate decarboxylase